MFEALTRVSYPWVTSEKTSSRKLSCIVVMNSGYAWGMEYKRLSKNMPVEDRFWARVEKTATCWLWHGATAGGYGRIMVDKVTVGAHRYSYEMHTGKTIEPHMVVDHLCGVKHCVRPDHLEPVTQAENIRRATRSGKRRDTSGLKGLARHVVPSGPNAQSLYCTVCLKHVPDRSQLVGHICGPCREEHTAKAMAALNARMGGR